MLALHGLLCKCNAFMKCKSLLVLASVIKIVDAKDASRGNVCEKRMQPDDPEMSPPKMKLAWPPKKTNLTKGSAAARRVILATEPHVSLTPTMLLWCLAMALMKYDKRSTSSHTSGSCRSRLAIRYEPQSGRACRNIRDITAK
jgi:hypothetical protein